MDNLIVHQEIIIKVNFSKVTVGNQVSLGKKLLIQYFLLKGIVFVVYSQNTQKSRAEPLN